MLSLYEPILLLLDRVVVPQILSLVYTRLHFIIILFYSVAPDIRYLWCSIEKSGGVESRNELQSVGV